MKFKSPKFKLSTLLDLGKERNYKFKIFIDFLKNNSKLNFFQRINNAWKCLINNQVYLFEVDKQQIFSDIEKYKVDFKTIEKKIKDRYNSENERLKGNVDNWKENYDLEREKRKELYQELKSYKNVVNVEIQEAKKLTKKY